MLDEHKYIDESISLHLQGFVCVAAPNCVLSMLAVQHRTHLVFVQTAPKLTLEINILNLPSWHFTGNRTKR